MTCSCFLYLFDKKRIPGCHAPPKSAFDQQCRDRHKTGGGAFHQNDLTVQGKRDKSSWE